MQKEAIIQKWQLSLAAIVFVMIIAIVLTSSVSAGTMGSGQELYFTILHTNDEHSALIPSPIVDYHPEVSDPTVGGFARLSQLVNKIRHNKNNQGEPVVLVSAGDFIGGSPYCWLIPGGEAPELSIMQEIGYDVVTIGNHEFDYGADILAGYFQAAGYPDANETTALVSSNMKIPDDHALAGVGIREVQVVSLENGLQLGFFGLMGSDASELAAKKDPVEITDPIAAASSAVQALEELNVDVVIAVTHAGIEEDRTIAAAVPGIDVIVSGHCHTALDEPVLEGDTVIVQSGVRLQNLGVLEMSFDPADGKVRVHNENSGQPFLIAINDTIPTDPVITDSIAFYTEKLNDLVSRLTGGRVKDITEAITYSDFTLQAGPPLQESVFGNFVTDAMRLIVEEKTGEKVDFAFQANGVIRGDVLSGEMAHSLDMVSFYDLVATIGLGVGYDGTPGYPLSSAYLTGNEVYRVLELSAILAEMFGDTFFLQTSGLRYSYDPNRAVLLQIPFLNLPLPSLRAVLEVDQFTGSGLQGDNPADYRAISRSDDSLYHVAIDYYVLSFLPLIKEKIPFYTVVPKDSDGNEIALNEAIVHSNGDELKFWQAVVEYAMSQPPGEDGIARVPDYYSLTGERINQTSALSFFIWPALVLAAIILAVTLLIRQRRKRKQMQAA